MDKRLQEWVWKFPCISGWLDLEYHGDREEMMPEAPFTNMG